MNRLGGTNRSKDSKSLKLPFQKDMHHLQKHHHQHHTVTPQEECPQMSKECPKYSATITIPQLPKNFTFHKPNLLNFYPNELTAIWQFEVRSNTLQRDKKN